MRLWPQKVCTIGIAGLCKGADNMDGRVVVARPIICINKSALASRLTEVAVADLGRGMRESSHYLRALLLIQLGYKNLSKLVA